MTRRFSIFLCFGLILLRVAIHAHAAGPIKAENDVVYRKVGDRELRLDIAWPSEGSGPFPAVLFIHGGAWRGGDKRDTRQFLAEAARRGYVAISPQYRFCPADTFPAQVHDVKAAVRWLRSHASEYKVDPDHIGAAGFSAGGHLALMLGAAGPESNLEGDVPAGAPSSRVQAVVNFSGLADLAATDFPPVTRPLVRDFLGGDPGDKPEVAEQASPVTHMTRDDPPVLTFHGTKDPLVPYSQAVKLADTQTAAGVPGRVELMAGAGHGWGGDEMKRTLDETFAFFDMHLKPKK